MPFDKVPVSVLQDQRMEGSFQHHKQALSRTTLKEKNLKQNIKQNTGKNPNEHWKYYPNKVINSIEGSLEWSFIFFSLNNFNGQTM